MSGPAPALMREAADQEVPRLSVRELNELGRVRLSRSFFLRDFLHSEIAQAHGIANVPADPELAIAAGTRLCEELLEPLQDAFGRIVIRSAYRSATVNALGHAMARAGKPGYNCASNERNRAGHIWDQRDAEGRMGATACIVIPRLWDRHQQPGDWQRLAWWIHDHLAYSSATFFPTLFACNLRWREAPEREIYSYAAPRGYLTRPGMPGHDARHEAEWQALVAGEHGQLISAAADTPNRTC